MLRRWSSGFFHLLQTRPPLPSQCLVCRSWPCAEVVCTACLQRFATPVLRCTGCALIRPGLGPDTPRCGQCLRRPPLWHGAHAWVDYAYPWNRLITRWKFEEHTAFASHLARWMLHHPAIARAVDAAELLIPLPLSRERLRERGYHQTAQLARQLCRAKCQPQALQRVWHTPAQSGLSRAQRLRNLRQAFAVPQAQRTQVAGRKVLLVDDVMTTGATLHAATRTLLQAGAARVEVLCVARTP